MEDAYTFANGEVLLQTEVSTKHWWNRWRWWGHQRNSRISYSDEIYFHQDQLGSTILTTNEWGSHKKDLNYDAFGQIVDRSIETLEFTYNGKSIDPLTNLYDYGFRDYSAREGRFQTVDPIRDGMNWYVYTNAEPINNIDPNGLDVLTLTAPVILSNPVGLVVGGTIAAGIALEEPLAHMTHGIQSAIHGENYVPGPDVQVHVYGLSQPISASEWRNRYGNNSSSSNAGVLPLGGSIGAGIGSLANARNRGQGWSGPATGAGNRYIPKQRMPKMQNRNFNRGNNNNNNGGGSTGGGLAALAFTLGAIAEFGEEIFNYNQNILEPTKNMADTINNEGKIYEWWSDDPLGGNSDQNSKDSMP